jgi:hypothetical protein
LKPAVIEVIVSLIRKGNKQSLAFVCFLALNVLLCPVNTQTINREMAAKILKELTHSQKDTNRIEMLTGLAKYNLFKPGEEKQDLDSASYF